MDPTITINHHTSHNQLDATSNEATVEVEVDTFSPNHSVLRVYHGCGASGGGDCCG